MMKVVGNEAQAEMIMNDVEALKKMANLYQSKGVIQSDKIFPAMSPEKLFGMSAEERNQKFVEIYNIYKGEIDDMTKRAKTAIEASGKFKGEKG